MQYKKDEPKQPDKILMFEVKSSNLKAIGYDKATLTLRLQFKSSNHFFNYKGVSSELFLEFMESNSKGRFFFTKIKGKFEHEKIETK